MADCSINSGSPRQNRSEPLTFKLETCIFLRQTREMLAVAGCDIALFRYGYVINGERRADCALEFGDGFVEVGLGLDLAAAGGG